MSPAQRTLQVLDDLDAAQRTLKTKQLEQIAADHSGGREDAMRAWRIVRAQTEVVVAILEKL